MKVIFVEDDRIEAVSDGYARNYLLPNKLAMIATPAALAAAEKRRGKRKEELEKRKAEMQALAEKLAALEIVVEADAGEGGKLFGSVTAADIAEAARKAGGVEIDRRKILLEEPIRTIGEYSVPLKLHPDVTAALKVKVSAK
jgi:large subunit ribosomal protein L9